MEKELDLQSGNTSACQPGYFLMAGRQNEHIFTAKSCLVLHHGAVDQCPGDLK